MDEQGTNKKVGLKLACSQTPLMRICFNLGRAFSKPTKECSEHVLHKKHTEDYCLRRTLDNIVIPEMEPFSGFDILAVLLKSAQQLAAISFVAIQQQERDRATAPSKPKQSLREIQQEEREMQAETEFMKWWQAEEMRLKAESTTLERATAASLQEPSNSSSRGASKGQKRKGKGRVQHQPAG